MQAIYLIGDDGWLWHSKGAAGLDLTFATIKHNFKLRRRQRQQGVMLGLWTNPALA